MPCKHSPFSAKPRTRSCKDPERSFLISVCKVRRRDRIRKPQARSAQACPEDVGTPGLARARVSAAVSPFRRPRSFRDLALGGLTFPEGLAGRSFAPGALALRPCALQQPALQRPCTPRGMHCAASHRVRLLGRQCKAPESTPPDSTTPAMRWLPLQCQCSPRTPSPPPRSAPLRTPARLPSAPRRAPDPRRAQAPILHPFIALCRTALACTAWRPVV